MIGSPPRSPNGRCPRTKTVAIGFPVPKRRRCHPSGLGAKTLATRISSVVGRYVTGHSCSILGNNVAPRTSDPLGKKRWWKKKGHKSRICSRVARVNYGIGRKRSRGVFVAVIASGSILFAAPLEKPMKTHFHGEVLTLKPLTCTDRPRRLRRPITSVRPVAHESARPSSLNELLARMAFVVWLAALLHVQPALAQPAAGYAAKVLANGPAAYWRLNETEDPSSGALVAVDASINHLDGYYGVDLQNGFSAIAGPRPPAFPGFDANNFALLGASGAGDSYVHLPKGPNGWIPTNTVTFTMWVNPSGPQGNWTGLLCSRDGPQPGGPPVNQAAVIAVTRASMLSTRPPCLPTPASQKTPLLVTVETDARIRIPAACVLFVSGARMPSPWLWKARRP